MGRGREEKERVGRGREGGDDREREGRGQREGSDKARDTFRLARSYRKAWRCFIKTIKLAQTPVSTKPKNLD